MSPQQRTSQHARHLVEIAYELIHEANEDSLRHINPTTGHGPPPPSTADHSLERRLSRLVRDIKRESA